ncbi:MAG: deoxyribose-phosphate aldolase [Bernardetiaceae bacterium]|jgi:deoxyribose-phosphate aldolase|nr:deoxyribose-phosphate aldolase [Bernardetiaceae bacterium]
MSVSQYIEHTNLSPLLVADQVEQLATEAAQHRLAGVCVPPYWVKKARRDLDQALAQVAGPAPTRLVTVIGFPLGYQRSEVKLREAEIALADGADDLDVVMNLSAFKTGVMAWVKGELAQLAKLCHQQERWLKVILETAYLSEAEIERACQLACDAGADFVKTSTGFAPAGATEAHVRLLRACVGTRAGVKASGGIKTLAQARALVAAGADRLGTSSALAILQEEKNG